MRVLNNLIETEKAYIAGFIDGEGCIRIEKRKSSSKLYEFDFEAWVIVTNTNSQVLEELKSITGVGIIYIYKKLPKSGNGKWRPCHRWQIVGMQAKDLLRAIYPYLKIKKTQTDAVLNFPCSVKLGGHKMRNLQFYNEQMQVFLQIKDLNRRGIQGGIKWIN